MKWKWTSFLVTALMFVMPLSVFAGPGEWDYLGTHRMKFNSTSNRFISPAVESGGGDFKICANKSVNGVNTYYLWEHDPEGGWDNDDLVGSVKLANGQCHVFRNIGRFVDGDNKKAEFYVASVTYGAVIGFWD